MRAFVLKSLNEIRSLPRPVHVLVSGQFVNRFGSFVMPFLTLYLSGRGIDLGQVALVLGAMSLGGLFGPVVSGYLADAIGRRNTIVLSLVTGALSLIALYFCRTVPQFVVVALVHGFCNHLYSPAANALLTDLVRPEQRVVAFALMRLATNAGFAAGPALAGLLFTRAPLLIFVADVVTTLVYAGMAFLWLPHGLRTVEGRITAVGVVLQSWREALADIAGNRRFLQFLAGMLLMSVAFVQIFNVLAIHAINRGLGAAAYGAIMGCNGFVIMLVELPLTQWARRFRPDRLLVVGYALTGLGCAAFGLAGTTAAFFAAMLLFTVGEMLSLPVGSNYISELTPEKYRGRYFGVFGTVWALAGTVGSAGIWFYSRMGANWWFVAGLCGLIGSAVMLPRVRPIAGPRTGSTS